VKFVFFSLIDRLSVSILNKNKINFYQKFDKFVLQFRFLEGKIAFPLQNIPIDKA